MTNNCLQLPTRGHGERLSRKQEQAIAALLTQPTLQAAAASVGVNPMTLTRWHRLPVFKDAYRAARREAVSQAIAAVQRATNDAVQTLRDVMTDRECPPASRIAAARAVLDTAFKGVDIEDLAARLEALEEAYGKA